MFQSASKKEIKRIACGTAILTVAELAFFAVLSMFDMGGFGLRIIVSALIGAVVAIVNFAFLCLMVQRAAGVSDDPDRMKSIVQLSYNLRLAVQAGWIVLAFIVPFFHVIAGAIPLLFPRMTLYYLQVTGKYATGSSPAANAAEDEGDESGTVSE